MKAIYVGGGYSSAKKGGVKWKLYLFLITFLVLTVSVLKVAGPTLVEKWINEKGAKTNGYAFTIRDTELSLSKGEVVLNDVKVFNPKTNTEILETPKLTLKVELADLLSSKEKKIAIEAEKVDLTLSGDLTSEIQRIHESSKKSKLYLDMIEGKIANLNIIEKKEDQSRTVVELNDVNLKVKELTPLAVNKKSEFSITSNLSDGGKLNLTGKTTQENGDHPWDIKGSLKQVSADLFNKIAGNKLPFTFLESKVNAVITARSEEGKVSGEISPEIDRLNLVDERPGIPTQTIKRLLSEDLTFKLPFTLTNAISFQYEEVFSRLKNYRKAAGAAVSAVIPTGVPRTVKSKKSSFWPF